MIQKKTLLTTITISILLITMLINLTSASIPDWKNTELLKTNTINGITELGNLLIVNKQYIPQNKEYNLLKNIELQRYDTIQYLGNKTLKIYPPIGEPEYLLTNNKYQFKYKGNYTITYTDNTTNKSTINVKKEDENNLTFQIIKEPDGITITPEKKTFLLTDEKVIKLNISVDDDVLPGNYNIQYSIKNQKQTKKYNYTIKIKENTNWEITRINLTNKTYKTGINEYLGYINIKNTGNKNVELKISKEGNATYMIGIPLPQTLYRKTILRLNFQIQIPSIQKTGNYPITIKIKGGNKTKELNHTIKIIDSIPPSIESINISSDKVNVMNKITVIATDNNDVKKVIMKINNETINLNKDANQFTINHIFKELKKTQIIFCAYDETNNTKCETINKTFKKDDVIKNVKPKYVLPTKKIGKYSTIKLFNITKKINNGLKIELTQLNPLLNINATPTLRIVDENGNVKTLVTNKIIELNNIKGIIELQVRSQETNKYDGVIKIIVPEYVKEVNDINFEVEFKDYDIPQDFTMNWFDNRKIICKVKDTGDLASSKYDCSLTFPINVKKEDLSFPTTVREKQQLDNNVEKIRSEMNQKNKKSSTIITILIIIILIFVILGYYFFEIYPYYRRLAKIKED